MEPYEGIDSVENRSVLGTPGALHYNRLFEAGYHSDWGHLQLFWLDAVLELLKLPQSGRVLDFGCGSGFMTGKLAERLTGWSVEGVDISDVAVDEARRRYNGLSFDTLESWRSKSDTYDLVFSHHVLEHVPDVAETLKELAYRLTPKSGRMVHVFPCGNAGTIEHWIVSQIKNGIEDAREGRYFFEEEGHIRRITSKSIASSLEKTNLPLKIRNCWYGGHTWAALEWMTSAPPWTLARMVNPFKANNVRAAMKLVTIALPLLGANALRWPAHAGRRLFAKLKGGEWQAKHTVYALPLPLLPISLPFDQLIWYATRRENRTKLNDARGGQMVVEISWRDEL